MYSATEVLSGTNSNMVLGSTKESTKLDIVFILVALGLNPLTNDLNQSSTFSNRFLFSFLADCLPNSVTIASSQNESVFAYSGYIDSTAK